MVVDAWIVGAVRELTLLEIALATGVLLLGGVLKGTTGFAVALVTIAGVVQFFPPRIALVALPIPFLASNVLVLAREGVPWSFLRTQTGFLLALTVGLFVGVTSLGALSQSTIYLLLAGYVGLFLAVQRYDDLVERYADSAGECAVVGRPWRECGATTARSRHGYGASAAPYPGAIQDGHHRERGENKF